MVIYFEYRLQSEMWELFIQFDGMKFVQHTLRRSDIRYLNLLSLMEKEGYGMGDSMYYVKSEGEGLNGLELVDSNAKVLQMIKKYESIKKLVLTVMRDMRCQAIVLSPIKRKHTEEEAGPSNVHIISDNEEHIGHMHTQESVYQHNLEGETNSEEEAEQIESSDESDCWFDAGEYDPEYSQMMRQKEEEELRKTLSEIKRKRNDSLHHCEGDTDVEDIFVTEEHGEDADDVEEPVNKKAKRQGGNK